MQRHKRTGHLWVCSSARCPGFGCSATGLPAQVDPLAGYCPLSAGPHQRATGPQTQGLHGADGRLIQDYFTYLCTIHRATLWMRRQTHFLLTGTLCIQRNSSTLLLDGPVCTSLAPLHPSTWKGRWQIQMRHDLSHQLANTILYTTINLDLWHFMIFVGVLTWCLSWWSLLGNSWQYPHSPCSGTACCPGTSRNQTGHALVSLCARDPPAAPPPGPHSAGPQYHRHCTQENYILTLVPKMKERPRNLDIEFQHTCFLLTAGPWHCPDLCSAGPSQPLE